MIKTGFTRFHSLVESSKFAPQWLRRQISILLAKQLLGSSNDPIEGFTDIENRSPEKYGWIRCILEEIFISCSEPVVVERNAMLDRIFGTALVYCRHSIREFFGSLRIPLTSIFAICIVLPIIIASMLPLIDISAGTEIETSSESQTAEPIGDSSFLSSTVLLSIVILALPIVCAVATGNLLGRASKLLPRSDTRFFNARILAYLLLAVAVLVTVGMLLDIHLSVPIILGSGVLFGLIFEMYGPSGVGNHDIDDIFQDPSFLNEVSSRIRHGEHHVRALSLSAGCAHVKSNILWPHIAPSGHEKTDRTISKFLLESARKDPVIASEIMRGMASHFTEIEMIRNDSRIELRSIGQSITVASVLLCPFVLGLIAGLSDLTIIRSSFEGAPLVLQEVFAVLVIEMALVGGLVNVAFFSKPNGKKISSRTPLFALFVSAVIFLVSREISDIIFF